MPSAPLPPSASPAPHGGRTARAERAARWTFAAAAIYGFAVLTPLYFTEQTLAGGPEGLALPQFYYGFIGTALTAQMMFALIARDPLRYRPLMLAGVAEKLGFGLPGWILWKAGRVGLEVALIGSVDLVWGTLFLVAFARLAVPRTSI